MTVVYISGKIECALFGDYVDELNKRMGKTSGLPIVVIQFAKIKIFRGSVFFVFFLLPSYVFCVCFFCNSFHLLDYISYWLSFFRENIDSKCHEHYQDHVESRCSRG
jgi:hypothetical protein